MHRGFGFGPDRPEIVPERGDAPGRDLHKIRLPGSARQRFDAQRPGPRKKIQDVCVRKVALHDAHPGFAHSVSRRSNSLVRRRLQPPSFPFPGYDAQPQLLD
jgi:hypothetical protein